MLRGGRPSGAAAAGFRRAVRGIITALPFAALAAMVVVLLWLFAGEEPFLIRELRPQTMLSGILVASVCGGAIGGVLAPFTSTRLGRLLTGGVVTSAVLTVFYPWVIGFRGFHLLELVIYIGVGFPVGAYAVLIMGRDVSAVWHWAGRILRDSSEGSDA